MRHLGSLALSLVLAPVILLLGASGYTRIVDAGHGGPNASSQQQLATTTVWTGVAAAIAAGILYAILLLIRLSPVGTATAGALLMMFGGCGVFRWQTLAQVLPPTVFGVQRPVIGLLTPFAIVLGAPLLLTAAVPSRWRNEDISWVESAPWRMDGMATQDDGYSGAHSYEADPDDMPDWSPRHAAVDSWNGDPWGDPWVSQR